MVVWVMVYASEEGWHEPAVRLFHSKAAGFLAIRQTLFRAERDFHGDGAELDRAMVKWDGFLADLAQQSITSYGIDPEWDTPSWILLHSLDIEVDPRAGA